MRITPYLNDIYTNPSMFSADSIHECKCKKHLSFIVEWQMTNPTSEKSTT